MGDGGHLVCFVHRSITLNTFSGEQECLYNVCCSVSGAFRLLPSNNSTICAKFASYVRTACSCLELQKVVVLSSVSLIGGRGGAVRFACARSRVSSTYAAVLSFAFSAVA